MNTTKILQNIVKVCRAMQADEECNKINTFAYVPLYEIQSGNLSKGFTYEGKELMFNRKAEQGDNTGFDYPLLVLTPFTANDETSIRSGIAFRRTYNLTFSLLDILKNPCGNSDNCSDRTAEEVIADTQDMLESFLIELVRYAREQMLVDSELPKYIFQNLTWRVDNGFTFGNDMAGGVLVDLEFVVPICYKQSKTYIYDDAPNVTRKEKCC